MNVLLLLATVIGLAGLGLAAVVSVATGARRRAAAFGGVALAWAVAYGAGLLLASLASRDVALPAGEVKRFCGFYFDCHIGVAVTADATTPAVGALRARGTFHVVTLEFSNDARRATLTPYDLRVHLVGGDGAVYQRDRAAEAALGGGAGVALARAMPPGGRYTVPVVFDLPAGVRAPRLFVGEGLGVDRVIEGVLIGDEDSFLHRKTLLELPAPTVALVGRSPAVSAR